MINEPKKKIDWKPAFEIFTRVSSWVVVPIILALVVGEELDTHFGTKPWVFLSLTIFGFFISSYGIVRVVTKYIKEITPNICEPKIENTEPKEEIKQDSSWQ